MDITNPLDSALDLLAEMPAEAAADPTAPKLRTFEETLALVAPRMIEKGFDARVPKNHQILSRYMSHLICKTPKAKKGLWICGAVGTGKTSALDLIRQQLEGMRRPPMFVTARRYAIGVTDHGQGEMLRRYVDADRSSRRDLIIDDIGSETISSHYGLKNWAIIDLIAERYELWCKTGARTHITTNIPEVFDGEDKDRAKSLVARYGDRTVSRLHEMCSHVTFGGMDRRKTTTGEG